MEPGESSTSFVVAVAAAKVECMQLGYLGICCCSPCVTGHSGRKVWMVVTERALLLVEAAVVAEEVEELAVIRVEVLVAYIVVLGETLALSRYCRRS
jgi:hypothetical protein